MSAAALAIPADTSAEAWEVFISIQRSMSPGEKIRCAIQMSVDLQRNAEAGLRRQFPQASDREIFLRRVRLTLGEELFRKAYGYELP